MPQLKVHHFGPIQSSGGWLPIHKVTVLTGDQATGKSTIAKLIATFAWLEKMLYKGDLKESDVTRKKVFENVCGYDGLPSDENILNILLADCNLLFDALLEIEDAL